MDGRADHLGRGLVDQQVDDFRAELIDELLALALYGLGQDGADFLNGGNDLRLGGVVTKLRFHLGDDKLADRAQGSGLGSIDGSDGLDDGHDERGVGAQADGSADRLRVGLGDEQVDDLRALAFDQCLALVLDRGGQNVTDFLHGGDNLGLRSVGLQLLLHLADGKLADCTELAGGWLLRGNGLVLLLVLDHQRDIFLRRQDDGTGSHWQIEQTTALCV